MNAAVRFRCEHCEATRLVPAELLRLGDRPTCLQCLTPDGRRPVLQVDEAREAAS